MKVGAGIGDGAGVVVGGTTLGGIACIFETDIGVGYRGGSLGVFTLEVSVSSRKLDGDYTDNLSVRFRIVAIFNSAFLVGSPASRLDVVGIGGAVSILIL